jgi:hypothetical protein
MSTFSGTESLWKQMIVACFKILSWDWLLRTEASHEEAQPVQWEFPHPPNTSQQDYWSSKLLKSPAAYRKRNVMVSGGMVFIPSLTKVQTGGGLCSLLASMNTVWYELMKNQ